MYISFLLLPYLFFSWSVNRHPSTDIHRITDHRSPITLYQICPQLFFEIKIQASFTVLFFGLFTLNLAEKIMCVSLPSLSPKVRRKSKLKTLIWPWWVTVPRHWEGVERYHTYQHVHLRDGVVFLAESYLEGGSRCSKVLWQGWGASWGELLIYSCREAGSSKSSWSTRARKGEGGFYPQESERRKVDFLFGDEFI